MHPSILVRGAIRVRKLGIFATAHVTGSLRNIARHPSPRWGDRTPSFHTVSLPPPSPSSGGFSSPLAALCQPSAPAPQSHMHPAASQDGVPLPPNNALTPTRSFQPSASSLPKTPSPSPSELCVPQPIRAHHRVAKHSLPVHHIATQPFSPALHSPPPVRPKPLSVSLTACVSFAKLWEYLCANSYWFPLRVHCCLAIFPIGD